MEAFHETRSAASKANKRSETGAGAADANTSTTTPQNQRPKKHGHICSICDRRFARSEHLSRHLDGHRNNKSWLCQFCNKDFSRRDVLTRHYSNCQHAVDGAQTLPQRVNRACQNCNKRKVKCNGHKPCSECVKLSAECLYTFRRALTRFSGNFQSSLDSQTSLAGEVEPANGTISPEACAQSARNNFIPPARNSPTSPTALLSGNVYHPELPSDFMQPDPTWSFGSGLGPFDWLYFDVPPVTDDQHPTLPDANARRETTAPVQTPFDMFSPSVPVTQPSYTQVNSYDEKYLPYGLDLANVDPLKSHHRAISNYLMAEKNIPLQQLQWLTPETVGLFIKAYFIHFHKHCPIIHLPHWSITTCSTPMIFSMILIAALYIRNTRVGIQESRKYCSMAHDFTMRSYQGLERSGEIKLESLQSLVLLAVLDRILANGSQKQPQICLQSIIVLARDGGFFEDRSSEENASSLAAWEQWALQESCRRTIFVLYCFDVITSVLLDERPKIATYEMHVMMPSPEDLFAAAKCEDWVNLNRKLGTANTSSYSVLLSLLLSGAVEAVSIPCTIMGCFVLVHGILQYAWETEKHYANRIVYPSEQLETFKLRRYNATQRALREWHKIWLAALQDPYCSAATSAGLYRERSLVYWYLAGILSFPNTARPTSARTMTTSSSRQANLQEAVPVRLWMQRLISRLEKGQLDSSSVSFETAQQFVECVVNEETHKAPMSSLLFPRNDG